MANNFSIKLTNWKNEGTIESNYSFVSGTTNYTAQYIGATRIQEIYSLSTYLNENNSSNITFNSIQELVGAIIENTSGTFTTPYIRPLVKSSSLLTYTIIAQLLVQSTTYTLSTVTSEPEIYTSPFATESGRYSYPLGSSYPTLIINRQGPTFYDQINNIYYYSQTRTTLSGGETAVAGSTTETILSSSHTFYPKPAIFSFNNAISGIQWDIDKGINSKIDNINQFQNYACQWKSWKMQQQASPPVAWTYGDTSGRNRLTALAVNELYKYIDLPAKAIYSSGDKVAASIFNGLADAIK